MTQLLLGFPAAPPADLAHRLRASGLPPHIPIALHANRRTLVSFSRRGVLRVHGGFTAAPDEVIAAIARWARPRLRRSERRAAARVLTAFPVHQHLPPASPERRRPEPARSGDAVALQRLCDLHSDLNIRHFGGSLGPVDLRLSARMRRRLGEFRPPSVPGGRAEIGLSRGHLRRDGWGRVTLTLLHEMVHQWQAETGLPLSHGREFRRKCRELGIDGRAVARFGTDFRS